MITKENMQQDLGAPITNEPSTVKVNAYTNKTLTTLVVEKTGSENVTVLSGRFRILDETSSYPIPSTDTEAVVISLFVEDGQGATFQNSIWIWQQSIVGINYLQYSLEDPSTNPQITNLEISAGQEHVGLDFVTESGGLVIIGTLDSLVDL